MGVIVLNASLNFPDRPIDKLDSPFPVTALVVRGQLEAALCFSEMLNGCSHFGLFCAAATFPSTIPGTIAPFTPVPAPELCAIDCAAFAIFEHPLLQIRPTGVDAERLLLPWIRIYAKRAVAHTESAVQTRQLLQTVGDVHMSASGAVLSASG